MKTLDTKYTIELTEKEIDIITTALHGHYKRIKGLMNDKTPDYYMDDVKTSQKLRNDFGMIVNRFYVGEDA